MVDYPSTTVYVVLCHYEDDSAIGAVKLSRSAAEHAVKSYANDKYFLGAVVERWTDEQFEEQWFYDKEGNPE